MRFMVFICILESVVRRQYTSPFFPDHSAHNLAVQKMRTGNIPARNRVLSVRFPQDPARLFSNKCLRGSVHRFGDH